MSESPYLGLNTSQWAAKTRELILKFPLDSNALHAIVIQPWQDIFESKIGRKPFKIGQDIFPQPQIMGFLLHELIPLELENRYPEVWRRNIASVEKDVVYLADDLFSIEIKTSSSPQSIFGNRSYAQIGKSARKTKSGYYLAINFEKFSINNQRPSITNVRFGWLDHEDWQGQAAATGQQARLNSFAERFKLLKLPLVE